MLLYLMKGVPASKKAGNLWCKQSEPGLCQVILDIFGETKSRHCKRDSQGSSFSKHAASRG